MKIVAISDLHGAHEVLSLLPSFDLLIIAGDITNFGPATMVDKIVEMVEKPLLAVPGNCDPEEVLNKLKRHYINLHGEARVIGGMAFFGCGGANGFIGTSLEFTEEEIRKILKEGYEQLPKTMPKVLVSHVPPFGFCDVTRNGAHVGSVAIADYIDEVDLIICGHIHEARGIEKVGKTIIVNCGFGEKGEFAEIKFTNGKFDIELRKL